MGLHPLKSLDLQACLGNFPLVYRSLHIAIALLTMVSLSGCNDDPVFPVEPNISFVSITPEVATQFTSDEIKIVFHYEDGDGDLGNLSDQVNNLFIEDTRAAFATNPGRITAYAFPSLTPDARNPSIQGDFTITLATPPYEPTEEPLVFRIHILDRAGHKSNEILTSPIVVIP